MFIGLLCCRRHSEQPKRQGSSKLLPLLAVTSFVNPLACGGRVRHQVYPFSTVAVLQSAGMERQSDRGFSAFLFPNSPFSSAPSPAGQGVTTDSAQSDTSPTAFSPSTAYPALPRRPSVSGSEGATSVLYGLANLSTMQSIRGSGNQLPSNASSRHDSTRPQLSGEGESFLPPAIGDSGGGHSNNAFLLSPSGPSCLPAPRPPGVHSSGYSQCPPPPPAASQRSSPLPSTAPTPSPVSQSQSQPAVAPSAPAAPKECPGRPQPSMLGRSLGDLFRQESAASPEHTPYGQLREQPRVSSPLVPPLRSSSALTQPPLNHYKVAAGQPGLESRDFLPDQPGQAPSEILWNFNGRGSLPFDDLIAQVHKLLRSNSTASSASSASTPRRPSGRLGEMADVLWDNKPKDNRNIWRRRCVVDGRPPEQQQQQQQQQQSAPEEGKKSEKREEDIYTSSCAGHLDLSALRAVASQCAPASRSAGFSSGGSPFEPFSEGVIQQPTTYLDQQSLAVLQELNRATIQQRMWEARLAALRQENADLQKRLALMEEAQNLLQQQNQSLRAAQHITDAAAHGTSALGSSTGRTPPHKSASSRLLAPSGYQGPDQVQSAPSPSTPVIRGSDKISVEQFLLSFPFTLTQDYPHATLKFCADHNLVVKLVGYHGKRVELLERQYCCRIQTSAQASSFPGYPNGRCVLFTGPLVSLLRACADLYAVVDTSSPGLRTNIEGYRVCLVVPGDFVGRLLRSNCAGLHALQEAGGKTVHIALGNLCVVMRGNYSERVLLIDGNIEGVCQVLESASTQLQDFLRRFSSQGGSGGGGSGHFAARYEFLDYPKRIELHLST
ncbi:hypothetical protein BESB_056890 [Besnoitia besnoiti]|uniref:KH domain protein n=1 Tax=Besnoitia besnoiti TaxID=94643 RepID=A0A2A9MC24_BESBE|nr:hypothetical protein BESB_056890 [Besnoitia besnoiti]PFH36038.1 hypothetical protein BESB_056890 [Besnoitia besnoiti]